MSELKFKMKPVEKKPSRRFKKGSKYDPIIDAFASGTNNLVAVNVPDKDGNYLRTQLNKRIEAKGIKGIKVSVINSICYLEKT